MHGPPEVQRTARDDIHRAMISAKIPGSPSSIFELNFVFESANDSISCRLAGKVMGVSLWDNGELEIFVSTPYFGNDKIRSLHFDCDTWSVQTENGNRFPGTIDFAR